jgi:hypothetical protein
LKKKEQAMSSSDAWWPHNERERDREKERARERDRESFALFLFLFVALFAVLEETNGFLFFRFFPRCN